MPTVKVHLHCIMTVRTVTDMNFRSPLKMEMAISSDPVLTQDFMSFVFPLQAVLLSL